VTLVVLIITRVLNYTIINSTVNPNHIYRVLLILLLCTKISLPVTNCRSTHLLKCSRIFSSRILSGRFPTQRWRVSLTIMSPTLHHSGTRPNTEIAHNDSTAVRRIRKRTHNTHTQTKATPAMTETKTSTLHKHRGQTHAHFWVIHNAPHGQRWWRNHVRIFEHTLHTHNTNTLCIYKYKLNIKYYEQNRTKLNQTSLGYFTSAHSFKRKNAMRDKNNKNKNTRRTNGSVKNDTSKMILNTKNIYTFYNISVYILLLLLILL